MYHTERHGKFPSVRGARSARYVVLHVNQKYTLTVLLLTLNYQINSHFQLRFWIKACTNVTLLGHINQFEISCTEQSIVYELRVAVAVIVGLHGV